MLLDCKHASRLLSQAQDAKLPWGKRLQLRLHLRICEACTRFAEQLRILREIMRQYRN